MPSSITHAYIAMNVYDKLDKNIQRKLLNKLEDYKTYSQGPDVFYFYHILFPITKKSRSVMNLGRTIHNHKVNKLFIDMTKQVKSTKNTDQFIFLIGWLTHYIADSTMHPYIEYLSKKLEKKHLSKKDNHFLIETYLDNYYIRKKEKIDYPKYRVDKFCFNTSPNQEVINLLNKSMKNIFHEKEIGYYYFKSLKQMKSFFYFLRFDPYAIKKKFYELANIFTKRIFRDVRYLSYNFPLNHDEFLNLNHQKWYYLENKEITSTKSIIDLYEEVVNKASLKIKDLYDYIYNNKKIDLESLFENKSYGTGLTLNE